METNIQIGYDKKEDQEEVRRLWQAAFHDPEAFADYYFQWIYPENRVITAMEGEHLRSMLHLNPYQWHWGNDWILRLHYVVGVATEVEFRRQGLMAQCLTKALQDMEKAGEPFTYLMPAKQEYYLPFQFVPVHEEKRWVKRGADWYYNTGGKWEKGIPKGIAEKQNQYYPLRSQVYRERLKAEMECEGGDLIEWGAGNYCAYGLEPREGADTVVIQQLFLQEITAALNSSETENSSSLPNQVKTTTIDILEQQICPELYRRYGEIPIEYMETQNMMLRILDLERFLEILPYEKEGKQLPIHLSDPICKRNNGSFLLTLSSEGSTLEPVEELVSESVAGTVTEPIVERTSEPVAADTSAYQWDISQLTAYLIEESQLSDKLYLMEIV